MKRLLRNTEGGVAIYAAFVSALVMGAGVLSLDFGKATVLKAQMQNAADAAAMSAAMQLNGQIGAQKRAIAVIEGTLTPKSNISDDADAFTYTHIKFYSSYDPDTDSGTETTDDADTIFVEVALDREDVTIVMKPILDMVSAASSTASIFEVGARAVATPAHIICDQSPFFICNPNEGGLDPANNLLDPTNPNAGRQIIIKEGTGGGAFAPGNFGLLCPDPDVYGNCGANAINEALGAVPTGICEEQVEVETAPGTKLNKVVDGVNQRFAQYGNPVPSPKPNSAEDVMGYPKANNAADLLAQTALLGDGWGDPGAVGGYFDTYHNGATPWTPSALDTTGSAANTYSSGVPSTYPTRYQIWLWENGHSFARNGKRTIYPVIDALPDADWGMITPAGPNPPLRAGSIVTGTDPVPVTTKERRVITITVLNCTAQGIKGSGTYPTLGQFVEIFLSECACSGGACNGASTGVACQAENLTSNGEIWGEVIGPITPLSTNPVGNPEAIVANVRLID